MEELRGSLSTLTSRRGCSVSQQPSAGADAMLCGARPPPGRAIRCAQAIISGVEPLGVEVRAGVHTGECEVAANKVAGIAVVVGARVAALAGPREVMATRTVKDLVAGSDIVFEERGEYELKGVPGRWRVHLVA